MRRLITGIVFVASLCTQGAVAEAASINLRTTLYSGAFDGRLIDGGSQANAMFEFVWCCDVGGEEVLAQMIGTAMARATFGDLGGFASVDLMNYPANSFELSGGAAFAAIARPSITDTLQFSRTAVCVVCPSGTPLAQFRFETDALFAGVLSAGGFQTGPVGFLLANTFYGGRGGLQPTSSFVSLQPGTNQLTLTVPFSFDNPFLLTLELWAGIGLLDAAFQNPYSYSGVSNIFNSATLHDILVTDANGIPIPGVELFAESDTPYALAAENTAAVPEPVSLVLFGTGVAGMLVRGGKRRRRARALALVSHS